MADWISLKVFEKATFRVFSRRDEMWVSLWVRVEFARVDNSWLSTRDYCGLCISPEKCVDECEIFSLTCDSDAIENDDT